MTPLSKNAGRILLAMEDELLAASLLDALGPAGFKLRIVSAKHMVRVGEEELLILRPSSRRLAEGKVANLSEAWIAAERPVIVAATLEDLESYEVAVAGEAAAAGASAGGVVGEDLGCTDLLLLPLRKAELLMRVRAVLDAAASRRALTVQARDLSHLLALGRQVSAALDVEEILFELVASLAKHLRVSRCSLVLIDEKAGRGLVLATSDDHELHNQEIQLDQYPELLEVCRSHEVVLIEDVQEDPSLAAIAPILAAQGVGSLLLHPLIVDGVLLGVLSLRGVPDRGIFTQRELSFASAGAHVVSVAVRNASLFERLRVKGEQETERREAAEAKLEELKHFEGLYHNVSEGILLVDPLGCVKAVNPAAREILGRESPLLGEPLASLATTPTEEATFERLRRGGGEEPSAEISVLVQGERHSLAMRSSSLGNGSVVLSFRDVTDSRRLANELQKTTEFLENLIESSADAIVASDVRGRVILWNAAAEEITGWSREEALESLKVTRLYPENWAYEVMRQLRSDQGMGKGRVANLRVDLLSRSGSRIPVSLSAAILYEGEEEIATMGIFTDLRERLQIERKLTRAQDRLVRTEQQAMIAGLAGTAAHELNQPLTSVMGYAELLKRRLSDDDVSARAVNIIYRESERMAEIVRKIGRITRFETKRYIGDTRIVDLDASGDVPFESEWVDAKDPSQTEGVVSELTRDLEPPSRPEAAPGFEKRERRAKPSEPKRSADES